MVPVDPSGGCPSVASSSEDAARFDGAMLVFLVVDTDYFWIS